MTEIRYLVSSCKEQGSLALFRGHAQRSWLLDSAFVRSCKKLIFDLPPDAKLSSYIVGSMELHRVFLNLFLLKYGLLVRPSDALNDLSEEEGIDAWF